VAVEAAEEEDKGWRLRRKRLREQQWSKWQRSK
jgi:hypothetical protein